MKTSAITKKRAAPAVRRSQPARFGYREPEVKAQQTEIRRILRSTDAQAKLTIGQPNDKYEQEADHVAAQAMAMPEPELQRQAEKEEEDEISQAREEPGLMPQVDSGVESGTNSLKSGGQPLDSPTRNFFEPRFGYDFSHVRVHADSNASEAARSANARAFTRGSDVVFASGEYQSQSDMGRRLLGHELTHVVQQGQSSARARAHAASGLLPSSLDLQKGPPVTDAGRFALGQAGTDLTYLRTGVVAALRATGDPIRVNTADAIDAGLVSLGVITRHPEPEQHASDAVPSGTYFFPDTDLNTVLQSNVATGGAANVPGAPANRIYVLVRRHYSHARRAPSSFFTTIVHEAQHYLDQHAHEVRARGIDREVFDLWLNYKTEFNAFWASGQYDAYPVSAAGRTPSGPRMLRWQAIREFLMSTAPYRARYRWLWVATRPPAPTGTGETRRIAGWRRRMHPRFHAWFRSQVNGYHEPEAFNRLNSPRIEQFYRALRSRPAGRSTRVRRALAALNAADIAEIRASDRLERLVRGRLRGAVLREVLERISFD